jgi:hypothetical protein
MIMSCFGGDVVDQNRLIRYFDAHASTLVVLHQRTAYLSEIGKTALTHLAGFVVTKPIIA